MERFLSAWLLSLCIADAQVASAASEQISISRNDMPRLIQCQFECIEISHEEMTNLLFLRNQSFAEATKLRKQLQQMVPLNKAKVVDTMIVVVRNGQMATTQSLLEYITIGGYGQPGFGGHEPRKSKADRSNISFRHEMPIPSYFETRNVGGTLEVEPMLSADNKTIDLRFSWDVVDHEGEKAWMNYQDLHNNAYKIEMSNFFIKRVSTSFTCVPSSYTLVATVDPQKENGRRDTSRKWLIFAKCEVQYIQ